MTRDDLIDRFLAALQREVGGNRRRWRQVLGELRVYDVATHPHCNWMLVPSGSANEVATVERLADRLREQFPILSD